MSNVSQRSSESRSVANPSGNPTARPPPTQAERAADARKAFLDSFAAASSEVDAELKLRANTIHSNQEAVNKQDVELQRQTVEMAKDNAELEDWLKKTKDKVDELGDWGEIGDDLQNDLDDLEAMIEMMEEDERQAGVENKRESDSAPRAMKTSKPD